MLWVSLALGEDAGSRAVADRWAPVIYQDVADGPWNDPDMRRLDLLTTVDFDGTLDPTDNVENATAGDAPMRPALYYDIVESETHYFILYSFFHPVDWDEWGLVDHENDMEHAWLVVEKHVDGTSSLLALHVQAHGEFMGYADRPLTGNFLLSDGGISVEGERPRLFVEAHGHGPASCSAAGGLPYTQAIDCDPASDEDLVVYRVVEGAGADAVDEPDVSAGGIVESGYALVPALEALWPYRTSVDGQATPVLWDDPFGYVPGRNGDADAANDLALDAGDAWGAQFAGDEGGGGGVPPWGYLVDDDYLGGNTFGARGDWLVDPAALFATLYRDYACSDREAFWNYLDNPYVVAVSDASVTPPWDGVDRGRRCDGTAWPVDSGAAGETGHPGDTGLPGDTAASSANDESARAATPSGGCGCEGGGGAWAPAGLLLCLPFRRSRRAR